MCEVVQKEPRLEEGIFEDLEIESARLIQEKVCHLRNIVILIDSFEILAHPVLSGVCWDAAVARTTSIMSTTLFIIYSFA